MSSRQPRPNTVRTLAECEKCKRALPFLSPNDVAARLEELLGESSVTPYPNAPGQLPWQTLFEHANDHAHKLCMARVRINVLAHHLRGLCVFCAPVLPSL